MSNPNESQKDFFQELYDVNDHSVRPPRIIGGSRISKEQAAALGVVVPTGTPTDER